jgi:hypothetical protein
VTISAVKKKKKTKRTTPMPASLNAQLADAFVEEDLQARRVEAHLRREVLALLALLQGDLVAALKASDPTAFALLRRRKRAGKVFVTEEATPLITTRYAQIAGQLDTAFTRLARHQADQAQTLVNAVTGTETVTELPSARELRLRVTESLFPSASTATDASTTGAEWWIRQGEGLVTKLGDQVQVSVGLDESLTQLTQRVTGTPAQSGQDGLMAKAATDATRLLTTQTTNAVSEARVAVAEANQEQFILVHQSVLDSRTSTICLARDGLQYTADADHTPIGHDIPYLNGPPYHILCRSTMITVLKDGGAVPPDTLSAWLTRKGTAFQDQLLGPTRARMFRSGSLSPRDLISASTGAPLTLEELGV